MSMKRTLLTLLLMATTAGLGWWARGAWTSAAQPKPQSQTVRVTRGRIEQQVKARGIVKPAPNALVRVGFPMPKDVARRIKELTLVEGDAVTAGQVLARLEHSDLLASLKQLDAEATVFERRLESARSLRQIEVKVVQAALGVQKEKLVHAERVFNRLNKLPDKSAIPTLEWETTQTDFEVGKAAVIQAEAQAEQVKVKFDTDIAILETQVAQAHAARRYIEVQIEWSELVSPIDGIVFTVQQHQGELTSNSPSAPVLTLLDRRQLQLHLYVDEADFGKVQVGQTVSFRVDSQPGEQLSGRVVRFLPQPILQENVVYYLAVVDVTESQRELLRPEMTALAHVQADAKDNVLVLPLSAVRSGAGGWTVLKPGPNGPEEVAVTIGSKQDGRLEIRSGLNDGDEVIVEP